MSFSLKNFSPPTSYGQMTENHTNESHLKSQQTSQINVITEEILQCTANPNPNQNMNPNNSEIKVYIRSGNTKTNQTSQECVKILLPEQTSLAVNKQISKDTSSMALYEAKYIFDNDSTDNQQIFDTVCTSYLDQIRKMEQNKSNTTEHIAFHPVFITFGQTNSGKTHSIIGNVDEITDRGLNGILIQFVSKLFALFETELQKECNIKLCGLEEYGECLTTLKLYDLFAKFKNNNTHSLAEVIGSPPSKSTNSRPTFVEIANLPRLEQLMADGCEAIHCGLFDDKIVSRGHCLFQLKINCKYCISFVDLCGYHPQHTLSNNVVPSNLTLNQFIQMLYHRSRALSYVPTQRIGLIPNLRNILSQNSDIIFLLHISNHKKDIEHTLKTLEIAKMFNSENDSIYQKQSVPLQSYDISEFESVSENKCDLMFSPTPKIRRKKSQKRVSNMELGKNIDNIPIVSRTQLSALPLEILQLKKSKSNSEKTFLVPLGLSTYDCFLVRRANQTNCLELQLRSHKSKFYIVIENLCQFRNWIQSQFDVGTESTEERESDNNHCYYPRRTKPILLLSILVNILSFFILSSVEYIDVDVSVFEPLREAVNRVSREFEIIHHRYHTHHYEYHEIMSLHNELSAISDYCTDYIAKKESDQKPDLFEFCQTFISADSTCPIDLIRM